MESSADRVKAFLLFHEGDDDCYELTYVDENSKSPLILGDLRAIQAEHAALWEVVRAADRAIFQWKKRVGPMSREDWRDFGSVQLAFSAARAKLAALSAEEKEKL